MTRRQGFWERKTRASAKQPERAWVGASVIFLLLGLVFTPIGLFTVSIPLSALWDFFAMKSWPEVPARILEARLTTHDDDEGGTLYGVEARYEYQYQGRNYQGRRTDPFHRTSDSNGSFQRRIAAELEEYRSRNLPFRCYVNPANPSQAVLYRELRWGTFFFFLQAGSVFAAIGLGLLGLVFFVWRSERIKRKLRLRFPGQPWKWDPEWVEGRIRCFAKGKAIGLTVFTAIWTVLTLPAFLAIHHFISHGRFELFWVFLFPLVDLALIAGTVRSWRRWRVFGDPILRMRTTPAEVGGMLGGTIVSRCARRPSSEIHLTLACFRKVEEGEDTKEETIWEAEHTVEAGHLSYTPDGLSIPVMFHVPFGCRSTNFEEKIFWRLELAGEFGGSPVKARFDVPVFETD